MPLDILDVSYIPDIPRCVKEAQSKRLWQRPLPCSCKELTEQVEQAQIVTVPNIRQPAVNRYLLS